MRMLAVAAVAIAAVVAVVSLTTKGTQHAEASFHLMRVHAVAAGLNGDTNVQYVELRMASGGQTLVEGHDICFFDADGNPWARFTFQSNASNGASGSSIIVGTVPMDLLWQHTPDEVFGLLNTTAINPSANTSAPVVAGSGKVAFGTDSAVTPGDMCGASFSTIDSVAYGTMYTGFVNYGTKFASDLSPDGSHALKLTGELCAACAKDNSADYSLADFNDPASHPRNNAGQSGPLGAASTGTPTASPSPTATEPPSTGEVLLQGDTDCDDVIEPEDAIGILEEHAGLGAVACPFAADTDCDEDHDARDALLVFLHLIDETVTVPECQKVGEPVLVS